MSCTDIHKPAVDNNYETCLNGYESTDCVVPSRYMDLSGLSLPEGANLTQCWNAMMETIKDQQRQIDKLVGLLNTL